MYTLDRFARNRYDSAIYKAKLKRNGVKIFYAKQPMPDTPEGIILESVLEGYAEYYSENLARSIKRGMKENALHGIAMGSPVLGYKIGNDRQYEIDPVGAKAVRTIFTMYAEGKSKTQIVNWLNEHGFKTSRGNAFNKNSLSRILRNDKYIGVYRYDDVVLEDAVPPIIDKTLFDKVQATFRHNYTARAKAKAIEDYLLTTKVFCGHCGEPMVGESGTSKTGKVHHYYKCVNRKRKHNCEKKVEKKEWLERTVVEFTVQQVLTDENIEKISTRAMELIEKELQDTSVLIGLQERLKETNKRIKNLMSAIEQGIITPTTKERLEELEEERRDLEGQIAREEMKKPLLTKERIMYWLESFKRGDIEDVEYQRRIIDTLVNSVYVYDDGDKGRKLVLTFNISGNNTLTISSSDIERTAPPFGSYSNFRVRPFFLYIVEDHRLAVPEFDPGDERVNETLPEGGIVHISVPEGTEPRPDHLFGESGPFYFCPCDLRLQLVPLLLQRVQLRDQGLRPGLGHEVDQVPDLLLNRVQLLPITFSRIRGVLLLLDGQDPRGQLPDHVIGQHVLDRGLDDAVLQMIPGDGLQLALRPALLRPALVIVIHPPRFTGARLSVQHRATISTEAFTAQQIVHFCPPCRVITRRPEVFGRFLEGRPVDDGLHEDLDALDLEAAQVFLVP